MRHPYRDDCNCFDCAAYGHRFDTPAVGALLVALVGFLVGLSAIGCAVYRLATEVF